MQGIENPAHIVLSAVQTTIEEWKTNNPPEKIKEKTLELLNSNAEEIVFNLLGFKKDEWGRKAFQLDHCNGRSGNSAAGDYLRKQQEVAINEWLSQVPLPKLKPKLIETMTKEISHQLEYKFKERLLALVEGHANSLAAQAFKEISGSLALDKYAKTLNLIST